MAGDDLDRRFQEIRTRIKRDRLARVRYPYPIQWPISASKTARPDPENAPANISETKVKPDLTR